MYNRNDNRGGYRGRGMRFQTSNNGHVQNQRPRHNFRGGNPRHNFLPRTQNNFRPNMPAFQAQGPQNSVPFLPQQPTKDNSHALPHNSFQIQSTHTYDNHSETLTSSFLHKQSGVYQSQSNEIVNNAFNSFQGPPQHQTNPAEGFGGDNFFLKVQEGIQSSSSHSNITIPGLDVKNPEEDNLNTQHDDRGINFVANTQQPPPTFDGSTCMSALPQGQFVYSSAPGVDNSFVQPSQPHGAPQLFCRPPVHTMTPPNHNVQHPGLQQTHLPSNSFLGSEIRHSQPPFTNQFPQQHQQFGSLHYQQPPQDSSVEMNQSDLQWINDWLRHKKLKKKQPQPTCSSSICDVQENVRKMMFLMASLQKQIKVLSSCDQEQFDEEMKTANKIRDDMNNIRKQLSTVDSVQLQKKIQIRRQKRERLKRQKQARYEEKQQNLEHREQLHKEIDSRLKVLHDREREKIQEKEIKKTADVILCEVRKKTQDVVRSIDLLKNLSKLRKLRKDRLNNQGVLTKPECDDDFVDKVNECLETLKKQKEVYDAENKALRVMMETEQEETKEKERFHLKNKENKQKKKADKMLFGEDETLNPGDPMTLFRQYYDQASSSIDSLIQIRCDWDRYIVPEGTPCSSRIPDGFIVPVDPCSDLWASRLEDT